MRELRSDGRGILVDGYRLLGPTLRGGRLSRARSNVTWSLARRGAARESSWWPHTIQEVWGILAGVECATIAFDDATDVMGLPALYWLRFRPLPVEDIPMAVLERSFWQEAKTHAGYLGPLHAEAAKVRPAVRLVIDRQWWTTGDLARMLDAATRER